jgi:hypothetical protein
VDVRAGGGNQVTAEPGGDVTTELVSRFWAPLRLSLTLWGIVLFPLLFGIILFRNGVHYGIWGFDFRATIYDPGQAVLHGSSPYPRATLASLAGRPTFVYPPLLLWLDAPLALLGFTAARLVWTVLLEVSVAAAMRVLGVRDWRCYAVALLSVPTIAGLSMGNVTTLLVLGVALAWRYRNRWLAAGVVVGAMVAVKLLLWPLLVWLLATRRVRATATAIGVAVVGALGSWAAIGFAGLGDYPHLLHIVETKTAGPRALAIATLAHQAGLSDTVGHGLQRASGVAILLYGALVARSQDGDRRAFSAAVIAALVISPVVWLHYFALLLIPVALISRRFGPAWVIPLSFWPIIWTGGHRITVSGSGGSNLLVGLAPSTPRLLIALTLLAVAFALTVVEPRHIGWGTLRRTFSRRGQRAPRAIAGALSE